MDKIVKFLKRLPQREREKAQRIIATVVAREWQGLDIKKLKGEKDAFRVRVGNLRIKFKNEKDIVRIIFIDWRGDSTYK